MRHPRPARATRLTLPAVVTALAVAVGGTTVALAGAGPATSADPSVTTDPAADVSGLLAGSYRADFARLSVADGQRVTVKRPPDVAGAAAVGEVLRVDPGTWRPAGTDLSFAWYAGTSRIRGASGPSYSPEPSVVGDVISVRVTGTMKGYRPFSAVEKVGTVRPGTIDALSKPKVSGAAAVGSTLRADAGRWAPGNVEVTYTWLDGRKLLAGGKRYTVQRGDRGATLRVAVTATRPGYRPTTVTSAPTPRIAR
jgi:hypothetical protein